MPLGGGGPGCFYSAECPCCVVSDMLVWLGHDVGHGHRSCCPSPGPNGKAAVHAPARVLQEHVSPPPVCEYLGVLLLGHRAEGQRASPGPAAWTCKVALLFTEPPAMLRILSDPRPHSPRTPSALPSGRVWLSCTSLMTSASAKYLVLLFVRCSSACCPFCNLVVYY